MFWLEVGAFLLLTVVVLFCCLDEEPVFDLTDVNAVHIVGLAVALLSCINDNIQKSVFGVSGPTDRVLFSYVGLKSMLLAFYFLVIWFVFFSHTTMALLAECEGTLILASSVVDMLASRALGLFLSGLVVLAWARAASQGALQVGGASGFAAAALVLGFLSFGVCLFFVMVGCLDCASVINGVSNVGVGPSDAYTSGDFIWHTVVSGFRLSNFFGLVLLLGFLFVVLYFSLVLLSFTSAAVLLVLGLYSAAPVVRALVAWVEALVTYALVALLAGLGLVTAALCWSALISGGL